MSDSDASGPSKPAWVETPEAEKQRFVMELEFVQCLANPMYLHYLASSRQLSDPAFVSYLAYLRYWLAPEYARFIAFPFALFFLEQVQSSAFRERLLLDPGFVALLVKQTESHWRFFRLNRTLSTPQIKEQPAP